MKHLLLIAASLVLATPAFASKARMAAFQYSQSSNLAPHIKDLQTGFDNPSDILLVPDYATFEFGTTNAPAAAPGSVDNRAEGGFALTKGDAKIGFYLGRKSQFTSVIRALTGFQGQENPIEIQYAKNADMKWGVALNYSQGEVKTTAAPQKAQAAGVRFGVNADNYDAHLIVGLGSTATGNSATNAVVNFTTLDSTLTGGALATNVAAATGADNDATYKGLIGLKLGGNYRMGDSNYFFDYYTDGSEYSSATVANAGKTGLKIKQSQATVGALQRNKLEGGEWYYGAALRSFQYKRDGTTTAGFDLQVDTMSIPFFIGAESKVSEWLVLRASLIQNILYGKRKIAADATVLTDGGATDSIGNNTTAAAGVGFLLGKLTMDATLAGMTGTAANGNLNTTDLLASTGLTYNF